MAEQPVNPRIVWQGPALSNHPEIVTLRDVFAAAALTGLIAGGEAPSDIPRLAYQHADAMLEERSR